MSLTCITCGASMPDISEFCPACGRAVVRELAGERSPLVSKTVAALDAAEPNHGSPFAPAWRTPEESAPAMQELTPTAASPSPHASEAQSYRESRPTAGEVPAGPLLDRNSLVSEEGISSTPEADPPGPVSPPVAWEDRLVGAVAYVTFAPAVVFLFLKQYQRHAFVRFHAFQSVFFWVLVAALLGVGMLASTFGMLLLWMVTGILVVLALFLTWLVLAIKALQGECFRLPLLGDLAEQVGR